MVKIDETYFDDNLEEELQESAPVATDESATESQPRPLLGDLLDEDEEDSSEVTDTETPRYFAPAAMAQADDAVTSMPPTLEPTPLEELDAPDELEEDDADEELSEESGQPTRKRSSRGLWYWLGGDMLEQPAFRMYIPVFIAILLMGLIHVTSNYQIISKRRQIDKLETRVKDLTYKHMESVSELTRRSIGGNFEQQLQAMGSDLEAPSQQSIILYRDAKE
ncbi:FtsL-like putative cell division protein [uncultured Porphyromonas sp.]|uniref:FtsL-like putative cell division protein n=1 Tax=uncultured Porphyromonas sp. TaxID=159274 RepID=UPI0026225CAA|nr:FtsL-like putative cell division protein [uncultured Porphyromonas sp.]